VALRQRLLMPKDDGLPMKKIENAARAMSAIV
jgi:hypothetical protein